MPPLHQLILRSFFAWLEDDAGLLGAGLAYYGLMSLAPLLLVVVWVAGFSLGEDNAVMQVGAVVTELFGGDTAAAVTGIMLSVREAEGGFATSLLGLGVVVVASTRLFAQLQTAMHQCWGIAPDTADLHHRLVHNLLRRAASFGVVMVMGLLLVATASLQSLPWATQSLTARSVDLLANGMLAVLLSVGLAFVFRWLPCARVSATGVLPGALLTAALLMIGKFAIAAYLSRFAVANAYGIAGTTLILVLWMAYSAQIFLFGAEFTKVWLDATDGIRPLRGWRRVRKVPVDGGTSAAGE